MKSRFMRGALLGLAFAGVLTVGAVPAGATVPVNVGVGVVSGGGTISPGLTALPSGQQLFTFNSVTITTVGVASPGKTVTVAGTSACTASGKDGLVTPVTGKANKNGWVGDTLALGTGLGTWLCGSGPLVGKGGLLYYSRVGPAVSVVLTKHGTVGPAKDTPSGVLACVFVANQTPPAAVTSYGLTCVGALAERK